MTEDRTITLELSVEHVNMILESLGALPFRQVYQLVAAIQHQARTQLEPDEGEDPSPPQDEGER